MAKESIYTKIDRNITPDKIKSFMRLKPSLEDTAAFFECSTKSIQRYIEQHFKCSFVQFRDQNMVHTRHALIRKAIEKALNGDNTMLIFCLKNLCGWGDRQEVQVTGDAQKPLTLSYAVKPKDIS